MGKVITLSGLMGRVGVDAPIAAVEPVYPRLLNYGIAAGAGALVGLLVASSQSKRFGPRMAGAGVGAALSALILAITWPKPQGA